LNLPTTAETGSVETESTGVESVGVIR